MLHSTVYQHGHGRCCVLVSILGICNTESLTVVIYKIDYPLNIYLYVYSVLES